jgi:hypothetical protein
MAFGYTPKTIHDIVYPDDVTQQLIDDLASDAPFRATVFAGVPLALTLDLDTGAVHQQVQRAV